MKKLSAVSTQLSAKSRFLASLGMTILFGVAVLMAQDKAIALKGGKLLTVTHGVIENGVVCLLYTSPSPRDYAASRMPSSA